MREHLAAAMLGDQDRLRRHPYDPASAFWRAADDHRVDLLLIDAARISGADHEWPIAAQRRARAAAVDAAVLRGLRDHELRRVLDQLALGGVASLLIKGAALAHALYREPHLRRSSDTDLLVRAADADRVSRLLQANGYTRATETSGEQASSQMHFDRGDSADHRYALDVHWRVLNTHVCSNAVAYEDFAPSRQPVPGLGPHAWTLCPAHALALACIHRVAHHQDSPDLLWLWDVHLLASALPDEDIAECEAQASRSATRAVCIHTLRQAEADFGTPAAARLIDRIQPGPADPPEASSRFLGGGLSHADILRSDLAALGWRKGVTLLREHLFPPLAYMRSAYGWPVVFLPVAYVCRIVFGASKWLRRPVKVTGRP